jgi:hypothetical protein
MKSIGLVLSLVFSISASLRPARLFPTRPDESVQEMLYTSAGKGFFPALVVIHEWWGLND